MAYRLVDHTADIAIEAEGADLADAMGQAAMALAEVVTGRPALHKAQQEVRFTLEAPDQQALVVAFLAELLWILEERDALWTGGGLAVAPGGPGWRLEAHGNAVQYDPALHGVGTEVKAVTYHDMVVEQGKTTRLRVVLDI